MIVILILGLYLSAKVVEPMISSQLNILNSLQKPSMQKPNSGNSLETVIQELSPQQKQQLETLLGQ